MEYSLYYKRSHIQQFRHGNLVLACDYVSKILNVCLYRGGGYFVRGDYVLDSA